MRYKIGAITLVVVLLIIVSSSLAGVHTTFFEATDKKYDVSFGLLGKDDTYDFVIITPSEFVPGLQPLVSHKESHGIKTKIVTLNEIYDSIYFSSQGRDNPEMIKYFIKNALENWGIEYVLLVGNKNKLPARYLSPNISTIYSSVDEPFISDLYYADIYDDTGYFSDWDTNNNDIFGEVTEDAMIDMVNLYPDVYIGRLLCKDSTEVGIVVGKIIIYENKTFNQSWFRNIVLCGGDDFHFLLDIGSIFLFGGKIAFEGEFIGNRIIGNMTDFNAKKLYASAHYPCGDKEADLPTPRNINQAINNGAGFIVFCGHGNPSVWSAPRPFLGKASSFIFPPLRYRQDFVQFLKNGNKLPIAVFAACSCGDFNETDNPIAWEFVRQDEGGSMASFAYTRDSYMIPLGTHCTDNMDGYMAVHLFTTFIKEKKNGKDRVGNIHGELIKNYVTDHPQMSFYGLGIVIAEAWSLFGDPTLKIGGYPP